MDTNKSKQVNIDFNIPYYVFEELAEYIEITAKGRCKSAKWENIKSLLNLAIRNKRLSKEQAEFIEETYCREKISLIH